MRGKLEEIWASGDQATDAFLFEQGAVMHAARAAMQRRVGVSPTRLFVLAHLYVLGELSQAELQRRLAVDGAAVTRQVKLLEAEGLISRRDDPADNRYTLVVLTPEGAKRLHEVGRRMREFASKSLEGVSPDELACVRHVMARMRENLERM